MFNRLAFFLSPVRPARQELLEHKASTPDSKVHRSSIDATAFGGLEEDRPALAAAPVRKLKLVGVASLDEVVKGAMAARPASPEQEGYLRTLGQLLKRAGFEDMSADEQVAMVQVIRRHYPALPATVAEGDTKAAGPRLVDAVSTQQVRLMQGVAQAAWAGGPGLHPQALLRILQELFWTREPETAAQRQAMGRDDTDLWVWLHAPGAPAAVLETAVLKLLEWIVEQGREQTDGGAIRLAIARLARACVRVGSNMALSPAHEPQFMRALAKAASAGALADAQLYAFVLGFLEGLSAAGLRIDAARLQVLDAVLAQQAQQLGLDEEEAGMLQAILATLGERIAG